MLAPEVQIPEVVCTPLAVSQSPVRENSTHRSRGRVFLVRRVNSQRFPLGIVVVFFFDELDAHRLDVGTAVEILGEDLDGVGPITVTGSDSETRETRSEERRVG